MATELRDKAGFSLAAYLLLGFAVTLRRDAADNIGYEELRDTEDNENDHNDTEADTEHRNNKEKVTHEVT